jgi:hypothetical protein
MSAATRAVVFGAAARVGGAAAALAAILAVLAAPAGDLRADEITLGKMPPFLESTITDVKEGTISFRPRGQPVTSKPLRDVTKIQLLGNDKEPFNRAEKLQLDANTAAQAVGAYDEAERAMSIPWQERLLRLRRLAAAQNAGLVDRAVKDWLSAMDESPAADVVDFRPKLAAKITGAPAAIAALESKLKAVKDPAYQAAIKGLLLRLYEKEGVKDKAAALAGELSGPGGAQQAGVSDRDQLRSLGVLLEQGKAAEALAEIEPRLEQYGEEDLPRAMLLAGKARMKLAEAAPDAEAKKKLLVGAGLSLMKVYAYYPRSADAPEALYLAGQAHLLLPSPNPGAAMAAFGQVVKEYSSISPALAASAKAAMEKVRK